VKCIENRINCSEANGPMIRLMDVGIELNKQKVKIEIIWMDI